MHVHWNTLCYWKDDENAKAVALLEEVIAQADAIEDIGSRIEHLIKGVFSGNIFDLGAAQVLSDLILLSSFWKALFKIGFCICGPLHTSIVAQCYQQMQSFW